MPQLSICGYSEGHCITRWWPSCQSTTAVWPRSIFSPALTIVHSVVHSCAKICQKLTFFSSPKFECLVHHSNLAPFLMKQKGVFSFFIYFSVTKSQTSCLHSDLFVCFQILVPHGWFLTCCVWLFMHVCTAVCDRARVHLYVCYCWCCCCRNILWSELCDISPCCWIWWQAECISSARRCHSVFCRLSATSALSLYSDWSLGLTSKFGSSSSAAQSCATWAPTLSASKIREAGRKL